MKVSVFGGNEKFISFLGRLSEVKRHENLKDALSCSDGNADALFILPRYDEGKSFIPEFSDEEAGLLFELIGSGKTKVYIENYPAYDYRDCFILGLQARSLINNIGKFTVCLSGNLADSLGFEILQKRNGFYFPCAPHTDEKYEILAEIKNCIGTHRVINEEKRESVALIRTHRGVYSAMADLTNLSDYEIFSYNHWKDFYKKLFGELLSIDQTEVESAFIAEYKRVEIKKDKRSKDKKTALKEAVLDAVSWHERSGIMADNGGGGVYEMFRSFDLNIAKNLRADSSLFTSALFMAAGEYFGNEEYKQIAIRLADLMLKEKQIQIKEGENKGVFKWFSGNSGMGARSVYVSDSSRVGNSIFALYRLTGEEHYKEAIDRLGEALLKWFGGDPLLPACAFNYEKDDLVSIQKGRRLASPEFYDAPLIFLGNMYSLTKDNRYKEQIIKTAECLATIYPNFEAIASHSVNFTYSRLLGALSSAQKFGDGVWTPVIDELLLYFKERHQRSGGFAEGKAYFDESSLKKDMEFAVGLGVDDNIADMVYCQNTLAYTLNILLSSKGGYNRTLAKELFDSLINFLLDTQISCPDRRFNGAWMRAFDMDSSEYYGCDKDFAWGPYCILTGWVTGAIPLVFLDILGLKTMY